MSWAKMHLTRLSTAPQPSRLTHLYSNIQTLLSSPSLPLLANPKTNVPTPLGTLLTTTLGPTPPQRTQTLLRLLFTDFLTVLETAISTELRTSLDLLILFEAADRSFLNLARTVARESSVQDSMHHDLLSSLWTRILGPDAARVRKYEENKLLLRDVREKTVRNKGFLEDHNGKLRTLQAALENLRQRLVSPLVRGGNDTAPQLTVEDQIRGLDEVSRYLGAVRQQQKGKVMERLFARTPSEGYYIEQHPGRAS